MLAIVAAFALGLAGNATAITTSVGWAATGSAPHGIAIDASGNVYTANQTGNTITKVAPGTPSAIHTQPCSAHAPRWTP